MTDTNEKNIETNNQGATIDIFDSLKFVLEYLKNEGWKIEKSNLYKHRKQGKIIPESNGKYSRHAVDKYAATFLRQAATGKRIQENLDDQQRIKIQQEIQINNLKIKQQERRNAIEEKKYIPVQIVLDAAFTMFRHTRDAIQNIPDRITPIIAAEMDQNKVREILTNEIRQALERLDKPEIIIEH